MEKAVNDNHSNFTNDAMKTIEQFIVVKKETNSLTVNKATNSKLNSNDSVP